MPSEHFASLLDSFGKLIELPNLKAEPDGTCLLRFDDDFEVQLSTTSGHPAYLVFCTILGTIPEAARARVQARMLQANVLWQDTGGATLGVLAESAIASLSYREPLAGIDDAHFENLLKSFTHTAAQWKKEIETAVNDDPANREKQEIRLDVTLA